MPCHIPSLLLIYYFPIPNCCFLHTFGHQKQVPCGDLSFSIFRYEFAQAFYLAWPSFESFLLVLVATIMRALTIIAIESVAWWLASLRSLNLAGESLRIEDFSWESHRGFSSKPGSPEAWSCGHSAFFDQKNVGQSQRLNMAISHYLTTLVPWKPCGSHLMPWTATTSKNSEQLAEYSSRLRLNNP